MVDGRASLRRTRLVAVSRGQRRLTLGDDREIKGGTLVHRAQNQGPGLGTLAIVSVAEAVEELLVWVCLPAQIGRYSRVVDGFS